jgi:hypothetical protein
MAGQLAEFAADLGVGERPVAGAARMADFRGVLAPVVERQPDLGCEAFVGREMVIGPLMVRQRAVNERPDIIAVDPLARE